MSAPLLELRAITKRFAGVAALRDVSLQVGAGEVVALIGENGAGKSTLMKAIGGVHQPDAGTILFEASPSPSARRRTRWLWASVLFTRNSMSSTTWTWPPTFFLDANGFGVARCV